MTSQEDTPDRKKIKDGRLGTYQRKIPKKITEKYLYNSGLAYLQKFTTSVPNFRAVMTRKIKKSCMAHPDQIFTDCIKILASVTEAFVRQGYLNDEAYVKGLLFSARNRGLSRNALIAKLQQKGLSRDCLSNLETEEDRDEQEAELIAAVKTLRRKRLGVFAKEQRERHKDLAALARAGFSGDVAQKALSLSLDDAQQFLASARL